MKKFFNIIVSIIFCVLASVGSALTFNYGRLGSLLIFFALLILSIISKRSNKRISLVSFFFSLLYCLVYIIGDAVYNTGVIDSLYVDRLAVITTIISLVGNTYMMYLINYYIFYFIDYWSIKKRESKLLNKSYSFLYIWLIIFLLWIPCFLSYYPGIYSYDVTKQVNEIFNMRITKFHPPIHTLVLAFCFFVANSLKVEMVSVYAIMQMVFLSYACMKLIKFLYEKTHNIIVFGISFIFLALNPVMAIISLIPTKDVYFAAFLLLLIPDIYELIYNQEKFLNSKFNIFKVIFFSLMAMLFRNNAFYVFVIFFLVLLVLNRKNKKIILISLMPIILFVGINNVLYSALDVREGNSREKLSLPMTQIAYVVQKNEEELSEEDLNWVNKYLSLTRIRNKFNPRFADPIKAKFKTNRYDSHPWDFYKLYFHLAGKYPADYISAFFNLNIPYWYPDAETIDPYAERLYLETGIYENNNYFFERNSKMPRLYEFYERFANYEIQRKYYILECIYNIHLPIWLMLMTIFVAILKKQYKSILVILPLILLWLTYLLGPVSNFRYIVPIYVLYPMMIYLMVLKKDDGDN